MKKTLLIILALAVVTVSGYAGWAYFSNTPKQSTSNDDEAKSNQLLINEWGVRLKLVEALQGVSYELAEEQDGDAGRIYFRSGLQNTISEPCASTIKNAWGLTRYGPDDPSPIPADEESEPPVKIKDSKNIPNSALKKVGDYYYRRDYPQFQCSETKDEDVVERVDESYREIFETMQLGP